MNRKLLTPYGLKFNPFSAQIPVEALWSSPVIGQFCWRLEQQLGEGGFALISGVSGSGKSATLRLLQSRLANQREVTVGILSRPQAALADFYRELGDLFGVPLRPHNRWASAKALREKWLQHIDTSLVRPVLLVDEAQEMHAAVLSELRLLTSAELDSRSILTVVLAGDDRLCTQLELPELVPLASRIRTRLRTEALPAADLLKCLQHLIEAAGNARLMTAGLQQTLSEHAALAATLEGLLGAIRLRFYLHRPADYLRDRRRLLYAVTWPATWLDERGLTCAPPRYHTLIEERLQAIAAHGNPTAYGAYFPAYLLKCLQDWFDRYGDELYSELKHIRNALDQLLASARFAERVQRHARQLDLLFSTHRLLERRSVGPQDSATDQLTLF